MKQNVRCVLGVVGAAVLVGFSSLSASASTAPGLGTATSFAILAGSTVTNTGNSVVSGDLGVSPGTAVTGFPPGIVQAGTQHTGTDPVAIKAKTDLTTAYGTAALSPCNVNKTGRNLGGLTLTPGTYCQTTAPTLTGTLTLSGNGVFIFQIATTLVTAPGATVRLINGAQPCNVFWQVGSSATLATTTTFVGTIMALASISLNDSASVRGRALAQTGAVTLINNRITVPGACARTTVAGPRPPSRPSRAPIPVPNSGAGIDAGSLPLGLLLVVGGLSCGAVAVRRRVRAQTSR